MQFLTHTHGGGAQIEHEGGGRHHHVLSDHLSLRYLVHTWPNLKSTIGYINNFMEHHMVKCYIGDNIYYSLI